MIAGLQQPTQFSQHQLIRLLKNDQWKRGGRADNIAIYASPFPDNSIGEVLTLRQSGSHSIIVSTKDSLSSGNAVVSPYLLEILLEKLHDDNASLHDFVNILNNVFFIVDYETEEYGNLLIRRESDHRLHGEDASCVTSTRPALTHFMAKACGSPVTVAQEKWLQYSMIFGLKNRTIPELASLLHSYFGIRITVASRQIEQRLLSTRDQSTMVSYKKCMRTTNNDLSLGILLGRQVWVPHHTIEITIVPVTQDELHFLSEEKEWMEEMLTMARCYLQDQTAIIIQIKAPQGWFRRRPVTTNLANTVQLGRGFYLLGKRQKGRTLTTIMHRSKE